MTSYSASCISQEFDLIAQINNDCSISPEQYYIENKDRFHQLIRKYGGILLRGFDIHSTSEFNRFAQAYNPTLLDYTFRSSPRKKIGGKIYTSTEYPADRVIPLHNENAYTNNWPSNIMFYCAIAPTISGGATPLASSRHIYDVLPKELVEKFEQLGILYVRNFIPGIDLSWQEVFQTESQTEVDKYCLANNISFEWLANSNVSLTLKQVCPAVIIHPLLHSKLWFNQAHLFHKSALTDEQLELLQAQIGSSIFPRNTYYGDGSQIEEDALTIIRETYDKMKITFSWQTGDVLVLDNLLVAHGRDPYQGERKILVAMS